MLSVQTLPIGDQVLSIRFGDNISQIVNEQIRSFCFILERKKMKGVIEWVPTYTTVSLYYDPLQISYQELERAVLQHMNQLDEIVVPSRRIVTLPVCYDEEFGPDLSYVANFHNLTVDDVIQLHCNKKYLVYMIGFTPGFPYLGGLNPKIATPRLEVPREKVEGGSVGIAGSQTGVYSLTSPGGWQIIGRTPIPLFDASQNPPALLNAGDYLQFEQISKGKYQEIEKQVKDQKYIVSIHEEEGDFFDDDH